MIQSKIITVENLDQVNTSLLDGREDKIFVFNKDDEQYYVVDKDGNATPFSPGEQIMEVEVTFSAAEIIAGATKTIVPGVANKILFVKEVLGKYQAGTTAFGTTVDVNASHVILS